MVGLSVVLEGYRDISNTNKSNTNYFTSTSTSASSTNYWQIVNKASMVIKPPSPSTTPSSPFSRRKTPATGTSAANGFLDSCFLCKQKLLPGKDIYMYKGEWGFCSEECRCKQIFMDEEETIKPKRRDNNNNIKSQASNCTTTSSSSSSSSRSRKTEARNRPNGFVY